MLYFIQAEPIYSEFFSLGNEDYQNALNNYIHKCTNLNSPKNEEQNSIKQSKVIYLLYIYH